MAFVQRIAHRGGSHLAPENTLAAFCQALTFPIDMLEVDVQMSQDGHAIVFHDTTVDRLTNGHGNILDLDLAYLRTLNAAAHFSGGWPESQQIPTLEEVLEFAKHRVQLAIEIKPSKRDGRYGRYPHIAETVVSQVRAAEMLDQVLVISFDWLILPLVRSFVPDLPVGMLVSRDLWNPHAERALEILMTQARTVGATWINMEKDLFTDEVSGVLHAEGFKVGLWTVNTLAELWHFATCSVDALTTDRPDLFLRL